MKTKHQNDKALLLILACVGLFHFQGVAGTLRVIDPLPKAQFESDRLGWMQGKLKSCKSCQIENLTPYTEAGEFAPDRLADVLVKSELKDSLLVINWNRAFLKGDQIILDRVQKLNSDGVLVVVSAGKPKQGEATLPLGKTLWGQTKEVLIVGELAEKEKLVAGSFFGPEMLTALGPRDLELGEGTGSLTFSLRLLPQFGQMKNTEWVSTLKEKRAKTRRLWPSLRDLLGQ